MMIAPTTVHSEPLGTSQTHANTSNLDHGRHRANSQELSHSKRMRTGSISGRLRTASDLEELGFIDKKQKGLIKDLIISGDTTLEALLDKYEKGEGQELLELIRQGYLGRKESIDLLDGLDFDFINGLKGDLADDNAGHDFDGFDFAWHDAAHVDAHSHHHIHHSNPHDPSMPPPAVRAVPSSSSGHPPIPPPLSLPTQSQPHNVFQPQSNNHSPSNLLPSPHYVKNRTLSEVAMDVMEKRKNSFDALNISEMIFDELHHGRDHSSGTEGDLSIFEDLFSAEHGGGHPQHRRSIRLDSLTNDPLITGSLPSPRGNVDLSAYATLAQSLQQNKMKSQDDSSKLKIKLEPNANKPNRNPSAGTSLVKVYNSNNPYNPSSMNSYGINPSTTAAVPSSSSSLSLMKMSGAANHAELKKVLGHTGSLSSASSIPGQKPIVTTSAFVGSYSPEQRKVRIERFLEKRGRRVWTRKVKYDVRKNFADSRLRIKGRFVKKEDEEMMRELMSI